MGKEGLVADTNVLISGCGWRGKPYRIVQACASGRFQLCMTKKTLDELTRVLAYPRLRFSVAEQSEFAQLVAEIATLYAGDLDLSVVADDPDDNAFLECAVLAGASYLVTGDPHLLALKSYSGVKIVTPSEFARAQGI